MPQISRVPLSKSLEEEMHRLLRRAIVGIRTEQEVADLLDDLLTPTEKIMIGKRLAIAFLLDQGYDQRTIHTMMKVSVSTVSGVNFWLKNKGAGYRHVISLVQSAEQWEEFWTKLDERMRSTFSKRAMYERVHRMPYQKRSNKTVFVK